MPEAPTFMTVQNGEVVPAPPPAAEPGLQERIDAANSAPSSPADYALPPIQIDGAPWQPSPAESAAIDDFRALAHSANLLAFEFANLVEVVNRPDYVEMAPQVVIGHLKNEWGAQAPERFAVVLDALEKNPRAAAFINQHPNPIFVLALYRAATTGRRK